MMARPGKNDTHHCPVITPSWPRAIMLPHSGVLGPRPRPRKPRLAVTRAENAALIEVKASTGPTLLRSRCRKATVDGGLLTMRAASAYCQCRLAWTLEYASRR